MGLGATDGSIGITTELELQTPSLTLSVLSGSPELTISGGTKILNGAATPAAGTGSGAASGSVLVTGTNISTMTFQVYLRAVDASGSTWTTGAHVGDVWLIGVSVPTSSVAVLSLPISNFTATPQGGDAQLKWSTDGEVNSRAFEIEANRDGKGWQSIGMVMAAGNSNTQRSYSFTDAAPAAGINSYQVKEVDINGNAIYSPVRTVSFGGDATTKIFPNPVKDQFTVTSNDGVIPSIVISDREGKEVYKASNLVSGNSLDIGHLPAGVYFVKLYHASGRLETVKVLKE